MTIRHLRGGVAVIGTAAEFASANLVLLDRQLSLELDTGVEKIGDGVTHYLSLSSLPGGSGGSSSAYGGWIYGDGSDGALTLHDGDVLSPGFYTDVTIVAGATVTLLPAAPSGNVPVVRCTGTWTINGTLDLSAPDAAGRLNGHILGNGQPFDQGQGNPAAQTPGPFLGGHGGDGDSGPVITDLRTPDPSSFDWVRLLMLVGNPAYLIDDYGIGGSGSGDGTNYGGAGGLAGRVFGLAARNLVHGGASSYLIGGGKGGDGGDDGTGSTGHGNCGGGGGGAGGWWITLSDTITGSTATIGTGGLGGTGCGTGGDGQPGMTGRGIHLLNRV